MIEPKNPVLARMLERLFAAMVNGPAMNCRPHASRQRLDLSQLARLQCTTPGELLAAVLGQDRQAKVGARVPAPPKAIAAATAVTEEEEGENLTPEERAARKAWSEQQSLLNKLRVIADDARTYEQDTGVYVLEIGFPLLSLPPGTFGGRAGLATRRILAPIAFVPVTLTVKTGAKQVVELACRGEGIDLVRPNVALLAWLEQQTGQPAADLFADEAGEDPWREIRELVRTIAERVDLEVPEIFSQDALPPAFDLKSTPRSDADEVPAKAIVCSAVLGLFPTSNQGLLRDMRDMVTEGAPDGPLENFVRLGVSLEAGDGEKAGSEANKAPTGPVDGVVLPAARFFKAERLITHADPCQTRAVRMAQACRGLVVHGPPGTGKSQTIANIIGDHLARGERVLFVCDKRTALDVVADRLESLGLGDLLATVHDPQRDQREFYRSVREQLENLAESPLKPGTEHQLARIDEELQTLHNELTAYYKALMGQQGGPGSFHHLMGQWLSENGTVAATIDEQSLQLIPVNDFDRHGQRLKEVLVRGEAVAYADNPWVEGAGVDLPTFLQSPMKALKSVVLAALSAAEAADAAMYVDVPPFEAKVDLMAEAERRRALAERLRSSPAVPPESVRFLKGKSPALLRTALDQLDHIADRVALLEKSPLDKELKQRAVGLDGTAVAALDAKALRSYAAAFGEKARTFQRALSLAGEGTEAIVLQWMTAGDNKRAAARKRLEGAAGLVEAVEAQGLDASMLARTTAAPVEPAIITEWLSALNSYLDIAGSWTAMFKGAVKKAAEPAVRHFGLSLNAQSAGQVRAFLIELQKREDLRLAVEAAMGQKFEQRPDEEELVTLFHQHRNVLNALADKEAAGLKAVGAALTALVTQTINDLIESRLQPVEASLTQFDLPLNAASAERLATFADALRMRIELATVLSAHVLPAALLWPLPGDAELVSTFRAHRELLVLLDWVGSETPLGELVSHLLQNGSDRARILSGLEASLQRAKVIHALEQAVESMGLLSSKCKGEIGMAARQGHCVVQMMAPLADRLDTLEGVLRIRDGLHRLPATLAGPAASLLSQCSKAEDGFSVIRRNVLAGEIKRRLCSNPELQSIDGHRLQASFERFRQLSERKKELVREELLNTWSTRQRERLLATTGTRLNSLGADLRRRLTMRGEKAMRLRQVIAHGRNVEGGDPLFDLRPVWMASPETVAQLFSREPVFDVIVFDEASQCRLEEALPVLTRGKRIVVAGDPKQLPPTRFFESAVATSENVDAETEQELFEAHQGEVEDLLTAALSLDGIEECYLNVHYRSRNRDLIGFSNEHFYSSRLQAIPGHPKNRIRYAPITLYRADGIYEKRRNVVEANRVCQIVHDLLRRAEPPSIGIACFNMVQRDLITETLAEWADKDADFAAKLASARERRGQGSSEGLFVKNLENVQGDERDHLIISTTYGPDKAGKFRRNFGPLGMVGGGRRLNVLVTRARQELHIVTSIPRSVYTTLPDLPQGTSPSGVWLLFAYLQYAEQLKEEYETLQRVLASTEPTAKGSVYTRPARTPSHFARALGLKLAHALNASSEVHWGNEGFCIDLAMLNPKRAEDVTFGIQCDMTRFTGSDDPVEWDTFQTLIHESQGWKLLRLWTPHFFRDADGMLNQIRERLEVDC